MGRRKRRDGEEEQTNHNVQTEACTHADMIHDHTHADMTIGMYLWNFLNTAILT